MNTKIRVIKIILGAVGGLSFFLMFGVVGGIERYTIPDWPGFLIAFLLIGLCALCMWINERIDDYLKKIETTQQLKPYAQE